MAKYSHLLKIPVVIRNCISKDGYGDKEFGDDLNARCYVENKINVVLDREGKEVVSDSTFYIENVYNNGDGEQPLVIGYDDEIQFVDDIYTIRSLGPIHDKEGNIVLWVVYA